jgi:hypothetical protein
VEPTEFSPASLEWPSYQKTLDVIIETNRKDNLFNRFKDKIKNEYYKVKEEFKEIGKYIPIIVDSAIAASPLLVKLLYSAGSYIANSHKGIGGNIIKYGLIGAGLVLTVGGLIFGFHDIHSLSPNHVQELGSPNGYEAFVPHNTINYNGNTDPTGDLILNNGTTIHNTVWDGQYAGTIINNHNQIVQLNNQFVGQTDPVNHQPYVPLQDFYVIKGQVPIEQVTINGQTYYVVEANNINPADVAGFYTYDIWIPNFVTAMNTPGTYAAVLPGNSPVFQWTNTTGTVAYQTMLYQQNNPYYFTGGYVLVLPNGTIIPYGMTKNVLSATFNNYFSPPQVYNPSS